MTLTGPNAYTINGNQRVLHWERNVWLMLDVIACHAARRFRDIAYDMSSVAIFGYPSCVLPPSEVFPGTIFVRFGMMVTGWIGYKMV